jgi:hypothetical protein
MGCSQKEIQMKASNPREKVSLYEGTLLIVTLTRAIPMKNATEFRRKGK